VKAIFVPVLLFALTGCSPGDLSAGHPSPLSEDISVAAHQLELLVPRGTSQMDAASILRRSGFSVKNMHGRFASETFPDYLFGYFENGGRPVYRSWQVAVVLDGDKVKDYRVTTGLTGP
jgi:hypothetical protein